MSKPRGLNARAGDASFSALLPRERLRSRQVSRIDAAGLQAAGGPQILIAGIGNLCFGDDGFGIEVLHQLERERRERPLLLPERLRLLECGSRALRLAYELAGPIERVLLIDAIERGGKPGSLYLLDMDPEQAPLELAPPLPPEAGAGALDIAGAFATARSLAAGRLPPVQMLGCEPAVLSGKELSPPVRAVMGDAVEVVRRWLQQATLYAEPPEALS